MGLIGRTAKRAGLLLLGLLLLGMAAWGVLALYFFGGESLRGMAESQILSIVIGTLSSVFVASPLLLLMGVTKQDLMPKARDDAELDARP